MAAQVRCKWVGGLQFIGSDVERHSVVMDAAVGDGKGEGLGFRPSHMLLIGLGGCTGIDVVSILQKQRQDVRSFDVNVSGDQADEPPWPFERISVEYVIRGRGIDSSAVQRAINLSEDKYCSAWATLGAKAKITSSFRIEED